MQNALGVEWAKWVLFKELLKQLMIQPIVTNNIDFILGYFSFIYTGNIQKIQRVFYFKNFGRLSIRWTLE